MNLKKTSRGIMRISIKCVVYIAIVVIIYQLALTGFDIGQKVFTSKGYKAAPGKNISVTISNSMSDMDVAELLEDKGIVENKWIFYVQSIMYQSKYKSGKYKLNTSSAPEDLIKTMSASAPEGETK